MTSIRKGSARVDEGDDGSGRLALIGLFIVLSVIVAAVKLSAQEIPGASRGAIRPFVGASMPPSSRAFSPH